jgi:GNAT superfamily N-acetyltransferase
MGIGGRLIEAAVSCCRRVCVHRLIVATATADLGNLRFYQRREFRMRRVVQDVFVASAGYPEGRTVDGIELRDQVVLERDLRCPSERAETTRVRKGRTAKR